MKEKLLQYIWQYQYYNKAELSSTSGQPIEIIFNGHFNHNQGPDFLQSKIKINDTVWVGNIEIHTRSSDWNCHHHSEDSNYNNIILHVVWAHDVEITDMNGFMLPTLELQSRVSKILLHTYESLMNADSFIACEKQIHTVPQVVLYNWQERLIVERLERKSILIMEFLKENNYHWEETFWWLLARNFGITVNSDCFEKIARSIPFSLLTKHKNQILQVEAILFGQASLLDQRFREPYPILLQKEYQFYRKKYGLIKVPLHLFFLRMRPANFPSIRLAQLSMLIAESNHLFSKIKEADSLNDIINILDVTPNDYWLYHYRFDEEGAFKKKNIGKQMINNILINTIIPILYVLGTIFKEEKYIMKALNWLTQIAPESNVITRKFKEIKISIPGALTSQALLELKSRYCDPKRCLECSIGNTIIKSGNKNDWEL